MDDAGPTFAGNSITGNRSGGIVMAGHAPPRPRHPHPPLVACAARDTGRAAMLSRLRGPRAPGGGGGGAGRSRAVFSGNVISGCNFAGVGLKEGSAPLFDGNVIKDNLGYGVLVQAHTHPDARARARTHAHRGEAAAGRGGGEGGKGGDSERRRQLPVTSVAVLCGRRCSRPGPGPDRGGLLSGAEVGRVWAGVGWGGRGQGSATGSFQNCLIEGNSKSGVCRWRSPQPPPLTPLPPAPTTTAHLSAGRN